MKTRIIAALIPALPLLAGCTDTEEELINETPSASEQPEWYYAGGKLGTSFLATSNALEQPAPAVEEAGLYQSFKNGEAIFEKPFMTNTSGVRSGLGPVYIRTSCIHCHPGYGHGKRVEAGSFRTDEIATDVCSWSTISRRRRDVGLLFGTRPQGPGRIRQISCSHRPGA